MHQNVHLQTRTTISTVFYIIKHYFSFFEMKGSDFVIYNLVWYFIDCLTFINQRQRLSQQSLAGRHYSNYTRAQSVDREEHYRP